MLPVLAFGLGLATAASGSLRLAHGLAMAGQQAIVICGSSGIETITLDRNGNPVEPAPSSCDHCADCMLASFAIADAAASRSAPVLGNRQAAMNRPARFVSSGVSIHRSRGPPTVTGA
ncbi:hypothetical protein [Salipiger aestuarii]|uniref:hypothetical protein n=1 Tax=Salipiger aestuarii TaxID=568098 RepID=UPI0011B94273|nr:hypothetical protein [Salipiger aestuarii]